MAGRGCIDMIGTKAEENPRYRIKRPLSERILHVFNLVFLVVIAFTMVYPFWEIFVKSFMTDQEINSQYFCVWPKTFRWEAYRRIFTDPVYDFGGAFFNSVIVTAATTVYQLAITAMTAYALTRKTLPGKKIFFFFFIITMYFSGGMIPYYIVVTGLGLSDTLAVMIIPSFMSVFNMLVMRAFFQELPSSLEEAATIDGASYFRVFVYRSSFEQGGACNDSAFHRRREVERLVYRDVVHTKAGYTSVGICIAENNGKSRRKFYRNGKDDTYGYAFAVHR